LRSGKDNQKPHIDTQLLLSAIYFTLGFLFTNYGFRSGSAAFVETIKAAEPITSASTAVAWGIERLGKEEVFSLAGIVVGVILSTFGQNPPKAEITNKQTTSSVVAFLIVMISNLCFSFRGLHQKLFRASPRGKASSMNDLNLQFRMQQIGVLVLFFPAIVANALWILSRATLFDMGEITRYIPLALLNGVAFTSYNLASTYVLTRISVVHHAALNCIRRVFAVIVTSVVFGLSITALQVVGIATSVGGFFSFSYYKLKKGLKEKRRRNLRKKYGVAAPKEGITSWKSKSQGWTDEKKDADSAV
jgi:drug/metabolite transporter (DMT)-like permease